MFFSRQSAIKKKNSFSDRKKRVIAGAVSHENQLAIVAIMAAAVSVAKLFKKTMSQPSLRGETPTLFCHREN